MHLLDDDHAADAFPLPFKVKLKIAALWWEYLSIISDQP